LITIDSVKNNMEKEKRKILVVDDELDMRIYISTVLETSGYRPIVTKNGKEGVEKAIETEPDLIVLDVMMPGEGGVLMYRTLKTDPKLKKIPVVMLSAVKKEIFFHYLKMLNTKMEDNISEPETYLEKPPDHEDLLKAIKKLLQ
jgi:two-component system, OmpR family, phosphate regulon response regulator PhoB